jgi:hypothetical protein
MLRFRMYIKYFRSVHDKKYSMSFRTRVRNLNPLLLRFLPLVEMTKGQPMSCLLFFCRTQRYYR